MVFHLWVLMMALVLLAVAFMWVAQIFLFSQNYLNAAVYDVESKVEGLMPGLAKSDLANDPTLLFSLGLSVNGKMLIVNDLINNIPFVDLNSVIVYGHSFSKGGMA